MEFFDGRSSKSLRYFLPIFILIIINVMILFIFKNLFPWDFPGSVNAGLLYSAVDTTNASLAGERRLASKLQRDQTVTIFSGFLFSNAGVENMFLQFLSSIGCIKVLQCHDSKGYSELHSSEDVSGSCHCNKPNLQVKQQFCTSVLGWIMPLFSLYILDLAVFRQNCLCWTTDLKK